MALEAAQFFNAQFFKDRPCESCFSSLVAAAFVVVNALGVALILSGPTLGITNICLSVPGLLTLGTYAYLLNSDAGKQVRKDNTMVQKVGNILVAVALIVWLGTLSCNVLSITGHLSGFTLGWIQLAKPMAVAGLACLGGSAVSSFLVCGNL